MKEYDISFHSLWTREKPKTPPQFAQYPLAFFVYVETICPWATSLRISGILSSWKFESHEGPPASFVADYVLFCAKSAPGAVIHICGPGCWQFG